MVRRYWINEERHIIDAVEWFDGCFYKTRDERADPAEIDLEPPVHGTLANWIHAARSHATIALKFGLRIAHRQLGGRGQSLVAIRPLEWVIIDHTEADIWLIILSDIVDADGNRRILSVKRPWLVTAIDLYSRMDLGHFLSFDPPSVRTVMECIKRVTTPKAELIERFGESKGATDGFGFMTGVILDNALENVMVSMQMVLEALGIEVEYAPRATPEYKAWVERYISTTNETLRGLPGGIPLEILDGDPDPRKFASLTLSDVTELLDHRIVTRYHLNVHAGIEMPPARKWGLGLKEFGRGTVDDARTMHALMGQYKKAVLTAEGIRLEGHVFHDPYITSTLMDHMARFQRASRQRRGKDQTRSIEVHTFRDPADCSHIYVIDLHTRQVVRLPNRDEAYSNTAVSFAWAKAAKKENQQANEEFHSREERAGAQRDFQLKLEEMLATQSHGDGKATARLVEGGRAVMEHQLLIEVEECSVASSISGMKGVDIPRDAAFVERDDVWEAPKGRSSSKKHGPRPKKPTTIDGTATRLKPSLPASASTKPIIDIETSEARLDQLQRLSQLNIGEIA
ncbi:DDE-type integrase/transposase/recombinase [Rhizobium sp. Root1220]|uniref:DDE-type integrase/transposase/recombinase n=1 Tax=Rhizobium sp. Root1220 TaxID=1736432 RepID=UPI0006FD71E5|nr:DDE-type integrase/transposase/recombinase [Rhizobium sp. Root1220]KQV83178.1 hypothetical protein ASC90_21480 [Rhizobium sp. Root1220]